MTPSEKNTVNQYVAGGIVLTLAAQAAGSLITIGRPFVTIAVSAAESIGPLLIFIGLGVWVNARQGVPERPPLLGAVMVLAALIGLPMLLITPVIALAGNHGIEGSRVTVPVLPAFVAVIAILIALAFAIFRNSRLSRAMIVVPAVFLLLVQNTVAAMRDGQAIVRALQTAALIAALCWYFYFKKNVVAYYAEAGSPRSRS